MDIWIFAGYIRKSSSPFARSVVYLLWNMWQIALEPFDLKKNDIYNFSIKNKH